MIRMRSTFILLLLTAGVGAFIWFHERKTDSTDETAFNARYALAFNPSAVTRLHLDSPALKLRLAKQGDGWHITEPIHTPADDARVESLLTQLATLERSHIITAAQVKRGKQRRADFGLDVPRWKISYGDRDHETIVNVGGTAPTGDAVYLQLQDTRDVIVTPTNVLAALPASIADYRNRRLLPGSAEEVSKLELRSRAGFVQAVRPQNSTAWQIMKPVVARGDATAITTALRSLYAARIEDFEASSKVGASLYGFDEPALQCSILAREGTIEQTLLLGKTAEGRTNLVYATMQGEEEIFTVDRALLAALERSADNLRDSRLLALPPQNIAAIRIEEGEKMVMLEVTNGVLMVTAPRPAVADVKKIALAVAEWNGSLIRGFNDQPGTNLAALGFAKPSRRITFVTDLAARESGLPSNIVFEVSSLVETGTLRTVRIAGEEPLLSVSDATLATLPAKPLYFRAPEIFSVETGTVRSLQFESAGRTNLVTLDGTNVPSSATTAALDTLRPLRAQEFVTEEAGSIPLFGLQPPAATLTVGLKSTGTVSRIVLLGNEAPGGGRYATVQGLDVIFTLDAYTAAALLGPAP